MTARLVDRRPAASAAELASRFSPPRRFADVRFDTFVPDPAHPSQLEAKTALAAFAAGFGPTPTRRGRRAPAAAPEGKPGRYLDGGFGVGKTHLLASLWHAAPSPKAYLTFEELTAFIGFVGMQPAVKSFAGHRVMCIDEFELDDVANTRMAVTFLRAVIAAGTRLAATSNAIPDRLGEGRFNAEDFERELLEIGSHWDVLRLDGPDYRATSRPSRAAAMTDDEVDAMIEGAASDDDFDALLAHLRHVHPVQYGPLLDGVDTVVIRGLHPIENQGSALLFVQLVDELYDREVRFGATGCDVTSLFEASYRNGGYRKKYGRCESRLGAMLGEAAGS
ncbi:MAG TPA: cell division protein ZapE [Acidimicrobiales bacterium]|nr:cell division protein ZapE [Acidimicrobiales bacterium]